MKILIVEDSDVVAMLLQAIFDNEPDMEVVSRARNGREAVHMVNQFKPDLVTMDIRMPEMDGFEATRLIMSTCPTPIVVISSSVDDEELRITFRAIEEGALAVLEKPRGLSHPEFDFIRQEIVDTVRAMAEVKLVRRRCFSEQLGDIDVFEQAIPQRTNAYEVITIGISTGGPAVLQQVFSSLPIGFPIPILVTQHIARGFLPGLVSWLHASSLINIVIAEDDQPLVGGTVYFAPEDYHLLLCRKGNGPVAKLDQSSPLNGFRPSATPMMKSAAEVCSHKAVGLLMTGMGVDGADGLLTIRKKGGHTLIQDESSAVVYGMPGAALALDAVDQVVQLNQMSAYLTSLAKR